MPYQQLEELTSRRREKVALFLTAENMAGLLAVGLPTYIGTTNVPSIWLRVLILIAAAVLGIALTSEVHGLAFYERVLWWLRGQARRRTVGAVIRPAEFTMAPTIQGDRALPLGGPLRRVKSGVSDSGVRARMSKAMQTAAAPRFRAGYRSPSEVAALSGAERETGAFQGNKDLTPSEVRTHAIPEKVGHNVASL